jgi:hypothetical protein
MTEAEARAALAAFDGIGGLERSPGAAGIAAQRPWEATPRGDALVPAAPGLFRGGL